jgi:hypothetical protein
MVKILCLTYENRKTRLVETITGMEQWGIKENDGGG